MKGKSRTVVVFGVLVAISAYLLIGRYVGPYEAKCEFMTCFPHENDREIEDNGIGFYSGSFSEIFNMRHAEWRSERMIAKTVQQFRADYPQSQVSDRDLVEAWENSKIELVARHLRRMTIAVRSESPELAAAFANAYAEAIESYTDEENMKRCEQALAQIHPQMVKQKRVRDDLSASQHKFRAKIDLEPELAILKKSLQTAETDIIECEKRVTKANEWLKMLQIAQKNAETFEALPKEVPQSSEISLDYTKLQRVKAELDTLKTRYASDDPIVAAKKGEFKENLNKLLDSFKRALAIAQGDLSADQSLLDAFKRKRESLKQQIATLSQKSVLPDAELAQLESKRKDALNIDQDLLQKKEALRIEVEQNTEIIRIRRPAQVPTRPVGWWPW